ncbi:hypothetical protein [Planktothricoides sp. SR001]|uniref:hypothetical protein n=1 Tax=Planktothricoides sp. SR001 TaxID=1705388 RepID=UPI0018D13DF1|nr:hypothetical protein [Planktothricoides sp. SR001]
MLLCHGTGNQIEQTLIITLAVYRETWHWGGVQKFVDLAIRSKSDPIEAESGSC